MMSLARGDVLVLRQSNEGSPVRTARLPPKLLCKRKLRREREEGRTASWDAGVEHSCFSHQIRALRDLERSLSQM